MIDGFVLAGGRASRMGVDKARLPTPDGWPWALAVASVLRTTCSSVSIVRRGAPDRLPWPDALCGPVEVIYEPEDGEPHPLWGLAAACAHATTPFVLIAPCDLVSLTADAVAALVAAVPVLADTGPATPVHDASGAVVTEQPLFGVFPRALGPVAARAAASGVPVRRFVRAAGRVALPESVLRNANTWADTGWPEPLSRLRALGVGERAIDAERQRLAVRGCVLGTLGG